MMPSSIEHIQSMKVALQDLLAPRDTLIIDFVTGETVKHDNHDEVPEYEATIVRARAVLKEVEGE